MFIDRIQRIPNSAFARSVDPDGDGLWSVDSYLLANIVDVLQVANWQRSADGSKGRNKPKPLARPSDKHAANSKAELIKQTIAERRKRRARRG